MTTSQARPQALRDYVAATTAARDAAYGARYALADAYDQLVAALPAGFAPPDRPEIAGPLGRSRDVDAHCSTVAAWFEQAGASGYAVATVDGVPAYTTQYSDERRDRLRERAEQELAWLRESIAAGDRDETTASELVATLAWMQFEIARSDDPYATAADLIDTMGPGDLHEALALLEAHARGIDDLSDDSWPVRGIQDLMYVVSMGLEAQPGRAADWADDVAELRDLPVEPVDGALASLASGAADGLALLGAYIPSGTSALGAALFTQLFVVGRLPADGLTSRLLDTTSPLHPTLRSAAHNPALAHDIVTGLLETTDPVRPDVVDRLMAGDPPPTRFDTLYGRPSVFEPVARFADIPQGLLGNVIASAVHPTLVGTARVDAAVSLTEHYVDSPNPTGYSEPVTRGLATATQPLLERWTAGAVDDVEDGELVLGGYSPDRAEEINDALWDAIGRYGGSDGGATGIASAMSGATIARLHTAMEAGATAPAMTDGIAPFHRDDLGDLHRLYSNIESTIARTTITEMVAALEASTVDWPTVHGTAAKDVLVGIAGEAPGGSLAGGLIDAVWRYAEAQADSGDREVVDGTANPFANVRPDVHVQLIDLTVNSRPDLRDALYDDLEQATDDGGYAALETLVFNTPTAHPKYDELLELRTLVQEQIDLIDLYDVQEDFDADTPEPDADDGD